MCEKLAAARKAAAPFGMLLIGRVESLIAGLGVEDAIARANAYAEAGADAVLIHGKKFAPVREVLVSKRLLKPVVLVPTLFPQTTFAEMQSLGVSVAIYANQLMRAMVRAGEVALERLLAAQSLSDADDLLVSLDHINQLVGVPADWRAEKPKAVAVAAGGIGRAGLINWCIIILPCGSIMAIEKISAGRSRPVVSVSSTTKFLRPMIVANCWILISFDLPGNCAFPEDRGSPHLE